MKIRSIGVCLKPDQPQAVALVSRLLDWAEGRDLTMLADEAAARGSKLKATPRDELCARVDLIIVIGGDGTLLAIAREAGTRRVPLLGINLGSLGFLTEINDDEMEACLERVVQGDLVIEPRMRLEVQVVRDGREVGRGQALNDAVVARSGSLSRMVDLLTYADGVRVTTYTADGLIISTPTGSTAYSLSAGGPLLMPGLEAFVLTPICPHSLTQRPIVLPQQTEIVVEVQLVRGGQVTLTIDGQEEFELCHGDRVVTRRSPYPVELVASPFRNRYEILHTKLRWGQR